VLKPSRLLAICSLACGALALATPAAAQVEPCPAPVKQPPTGSPALLRCTQIVAHPVNETVIPTETFNYRIKTPQTYPSKDIWSPYAEAAVLADFWNLWNTNFLANLWIEVIDEPYDNGVMGKHVVFHIEERSRLKVVDYMPVTTTKQKPKLRVDVSKIEEKLREENIELRLDSFVDEATIRRVKGIIRDLHAEEGYNDPIVDTKMTDVEEGSKLVRLEFLIDHGPKVEIREIVFDGNEQVSDGKLRGRMKENKATNWLSFITSAGTYKESKFADDADLITAYYQNNGFARVQVGQPQIERIEDSKDGTKRYVRLRIPVDEGVRYTFGTFEIGGDTTLKPEAIRSLFKIKEGDEYSAQKIRKGIEKAQELYGAFGFWQWQPEVEPFPRGIDRETGEPIDGKTPPPIMDVTIRMKEGKQFTVNRITFTGNSTTHDSVIRREMRLYEGGLFNMESLKDSVRRLNQLGYFKPFEGKEGEMDVSQTPNTDDKVDVKLKFEEQNRNQLAFGAGVSQFDGFFGQLSFQTSNFLGRGETMGVSLQKGSQARQYQVSFSEPYLFDRPITVGTDLYTRQYVFPLQYTQESTGGNVVVGFPLADYTRLFTSYSYERVKVLDINPGYFVPGVIDSSPFLRDSLLIDQGGRRTVSKISPSVVFNTVNQPIFPTMGKRLTSSFDFAGLGGNTTYFQTRLEGIWYHPLTPTGKMAFGIRGEAQYVRPYGQTTTLPIFEKLFLGGEYTVRGFDIRSIGPRDSTSGVATGGNKTLVFNAEYYINIFGPVRLLGFFDAGQVRDVGERFVMKEPLTQLILPHTPIITDPFSQTHLVTIPGSIRTDVIGRTSAFKTSTGLEVRFFMPVLNVPFRLIAAYNPSRTGVLNNQLRPTQRFTFRFAVGTTF